MEGFFQLREQGLVECAGAGGERHRDEECEGAAGSAVWESGAVDGGFAAGAGDAGFY